MHLFFACLKFFGRLRLTKAATNPAEERRRVDRVGHGRVRGCRVARCFGEASPLSVFAFRAKI